MAIAIAAGSAACSGTEVENTPVSVEQAADEDDFGISPQQDVEITRDEDGNVTDFKIIPNDEQTIKGDLDGDGENDDTLIINSDSSNRQGGDINLLGEGQPGAVPGSTIELFGLDGIMPPPPPEEYVMPTPGFALEQVISELAAGTYEYNITLGSWEGLLIVPDDNGIGVFNRAVFFEDAEHGESYLGTVYQYDQNGELYYSPNGVRVGTFPEGQPGSVAVFTYEEHLYVGGDGKTASSNRIRIENPGTVTADGSIEDIEFIDANDKPVTPTYAYYSLDKMDELLEAIAAGKYDTFHHEYGVPAGVITSRQPN